MGSTFRLGAAVFALVAGCSKVSYIDRSTLPTGTIVEDKGHFFFGGLVGDKLVDAGRACSTGVSRIQSRFSPSDVLYGALTVGIYTPRSYRIECGRSR